MIAIRLASEHRTIFFCRIGLASKLAKPNSTNFQTDKDLRLARKDALSATTLLDSSDLVSKLAKPKSNNLKNGEIIALSVIGHA